MGCWGDRCSPSHCHSTLRPRSRNASNTVSGSASSIDTNECSSDSHEQALCLGGSSTVASRKAAAIAAVHRTNCWVRLVVAQLTESRNKTTPGLERVTAANWGEPSPRAALRRPW